MNALQSPTWHPIHKLPDSLPSSYRIGLLHKDSFMERLKDHGIQDAQIRVLREGWQEDSSQTWIREVLIHNQTTQWMYAQTLIPSTFEPEKLQQIMTLGKDSLGSLLFHDPTVRRGEFEIAHLNPTLDLFQKAISYTQINTNELWARRSLFYLREHAFQLTEVFFQHF